MRRFLAKTIFATTALATFLASTTFPMQGITASADGLPLPANLAGDYSCARTGRFDDYFGFRLTIPADPPRGASTRITWAALIIRGRRSGRPDDELLYEEVLRLDRSRDGRSFLLSRGLAPLIRLSLPTSAKLEQARRNGPAADIDIFLEVVAPSLRIQGMRRGVPVACAEAA